MISWKDSWLQLVWDVGLSDHLGDVAEALRDYAKREGRPMPDGYTALDEWASWAAEEDVRRRRPTSGDGR